MRHFGEWIVHCHECVRDAVAEILPHGPVRKSRQLLVDISVISRGDAGTGIQRVVRAILSELTARLPDDVVMRTVSARKYRGYRYTSNPFGPDVAIGGRIRVQADDIFLGLDLAAHLLPRHAGQIGRWKRRSVTIHLLVYDLLPLRHPEWFNHRSATNFARWLDFLATMADGALCISEQVRQDLADWLVHDGRSPDRAPALATIRLGADMSATRPSKGLPADFDALLAALAQRPWALAVGTIEPRKGYETLLAAFEAIWASDSSAALVVVGRPGWKTEQLQYRLRHHVEAGRRLYWLEDVSDEALELLYAACHGVIVASFGEGYGLPIIEAARHGKKILARDLPVFREVGGPSVSYFEDDNSAILADTILAWLSSPHTPSSINYDPPSWRQSAEDILLKIGVPPKTPG